MKTVGYFDGTDSALLTKIAAHGFFTLSLGNQWDGHGKVATHLEPGEVDLIIAYLHKLLIPRGEEPGPVPSPVRLLYSAKTYNIPILVIVDKSHHKRAKDVLGEATEIEEFVAPEELDGKVCEILGL